MSVTFEFGNRMVPERFWKKIVVEQASELVDSPCWVWQGYADGKGYGKLSFNFRPKVQTWSAHRYFYENLVRPLPDALILDHLCRVTRCVNPAHLEPVTQKENVLRGEGWGAKNARKTHCSRGHLLEHPNLDTFQLERYGRRACLECKRMRGRRWARKHYVPHPKQGRA